LTHERVWAAIDQLAAGAGLSARALARRSGLSPATFDPSKRMTPAGRDRWPSLRSVAKALTATNASIETFATLLRDSQSPSAPDAAIMRSSDAAARGRDAEFVTK